MTRFEHPDTAAPGQKPTGPAGTGLVPPGYLPTRGFVRRYPASLGPMPEATLTCFVDLGLSDAEIALYFHLDCDQVRVLARPIRERFAA
ncbi:hypothetical protein [Solirhodobacter olei]|uniref:hypothetical protein n=1 Tax=Solirhodobacter olei TaxID=2493082 RepID=UPI000FDAF604|nr:hypothetical protein [Solirhodobacter olei]